MLFCLFYISTGSDVMLHVLRVFSCPVLFFCHLLYSIQAYSFARCNLQGADPRYRQLLVITESHCLDLCLMSDSQAQLFRSKSSPGHLSNAATTDLPHLVMYSCQFLSTVFSGIAQVLGFLFDFSSLKSCWKEQCHWKYFSLKSLNASVLRHAFHTLQFF